MKSVAILTPQFYDHAGKDIFFGGGERYLVDLAKLMKEMGYHVEAYQSASSRWTNTYDGLTIHGLPYPRFVSDVFPDLNKEFHKVTKDYDYVLYLCFDMCYPEVRQKSIAISHGIWWDTTERKWWRTQDWYATIKKCLANPYIIVSVDTNTINWCRAVYPELASKFSYIPNYADTSKYTPKPKVGDKFTVLYPRRLVGARGWKQTIEAAKMLLPKHKDMEFYFVGRGTPGDEEWMRKWAAQEERVRYEWLDMNDMPKAYEQADIVLIPTLGIEGTSLSCLEALACGKPVIAGCAGGLTDLILQGYNGILINVTPESLAKYIEMLYNDPSLRERLGAKAREVALSFSKNIWEERWRRLIAQIYPA